MTALPLAGRRVVITRAAAQSAELAERLVALGAQPVVVPLIEIVEPADGGAARREALARLDTFEWLIVTSPNGADRVAGALKAAGALQPKVAVVGSATAARLGRPADLIPQRQIAEGLLDVFPAGAGRVLIVQAEQARSTLADGLRAMGWLVETVVGYRTVAARPSTADLLAVHAADAVLFLSGSAIRSWKSIFGMSTPPVVIVIGPATAAVADEIGLKVDAIAADHSLGGMVTCLLTQLGESD